MLDRREIRTAVIEAGAKNRKVMCGAHGGSGLTNAIQAGVASIEHGLLLSEEQAHQQMAAAGCLFVPMLMTVNELVCWAGGVPDTRLSTAEHTRPKVLDVKPLIGEAVRIAKNEFARADAIADARAHATHEAATAGAECETIQIVGVEDIPVACMENSMIRARVNAVGDLNLTSRRGSAGRTRAGVQTNGKRRVEP